jgi:hypothetical protein
MLAVGYCAEGIGAVRAAKKAGIPVSYILFCLYNCVFVTITLLKLNSI